MQMKHDLEHIKRFVEEDRFVISNHARVRMFPRNISTFPHHVVTAECEDYIRIVAVYKPEEDKWIKYRIRKKEVKDETR